MKRKILVIDDEPAIRKSFVLALEDTDYLVETAESGEKGVEAARRGRFDLVYLDLKMPGLNGIETLRLLRAIDAGMPIYIITAFYEEFLEPLQLAERDGLEFEVLRKPIGADDILLVTQSLLEGSVSY